MCNLFMCKYFFMINMLLLFSYGNSKSEVRGASNNPISELVSMLAACVHAGACGRQMSLISADSS